MKLTRRQFGQSLGAGLVASLIPKISEGCTMSNIYANIHTTTTALSRFNVAKSLLGTTNCSILFLGDSTVFGAGSSNLVNEGSGSNLYQYSIPTQLAKSLQARHIPANANGICFGPIGGNQGRLASNGYTDPRVTTDKVYPYPFFPSLGGFLAEITPGGHINYNLENVCDIWRILYVPGKTHGILTVSVDGGTKTQFSTAGENNNIRDGYFFSSGNQLKISNNSLNHCFIASIEGYSSKNPACVITNAGWPGASLGDFSSYNNNYNTPTGFNPLEAALTFRPNLYIVEAGINDWYKGTPYSTNFESKLYKFLSQLKNVADVVLVSGVPSNPNASPTCIISNQQEFVAIMKSVASILDIAFVDNWTSFGPWAGNIKMYSQDPILRDLHPNMIGTAQFAESIATVLALS